MLSSLTLTILLSCPLVWSEKACKDSAFFDLQGTRSFIRFRGGDQKSISRSNRAMRKSQLIQYNKELTNLAKKANWTRALVKISEMK
mmetsp:Transcript_1869/g.2620  ORF Transcript_1869/g.2620 Transcript_1869/m.2620 type:complete len:87 (-) Transcript_1869:928-1188(-)